MLWLLQRSYLCSPDEWRSSATLNFAQGCVQGRSPPCFSSFYYSTRGQGDSIARGLCHHTYCKSCYPIIICKECLQDCCQLLTYGSNVVSLVCLQPFGTYILAETEQQRRTALLPPKLDHRRKKLTESFWKVTPQSFPSNRQCVLKPAI